jgi:hypothetical protein
VHEDTMTETSSAAVFVTLVILVFPVPVKSFKKLNCPETPAFGQIPLCEALVRETAGPVRQPTGLFHRSNILKIIKVTQKLQDSRFSLLTVSKKFIFIKHGETMDSEAVGDKIRGGYKSNADRYDDYIL